MIAILLAVSATVAPAPPAETADTLADLQHIYEQSCVSRAYGSFDDVCDGISRQIGAYKKQLARERRGGTARESPPALQAPSAPAPIPPDAGHPSVATTVSESRP